MVIIVLPYHAKFSLDLVPMHPFSLAEDLKIRHVCLSIGLSFCACMVHPEWFPVKLGTVMTYYWDSIHVNRFCLGAKIMLITDVFHLIWTYILSMYTDTLQLLPLYPNGVIKDCFCLIFT